MILVGGRGVVQAEKEPENKYRRLEIEINEIEKVSSELRRMFINIGVQFDPEEEQSEDLVAEPNLIDLLTYGPMRLKEITKDIRTCITQFQNSLK